MRFRDLVIRNIVSPFGLATTSYAFFLLACLIPPSVYSYYMMEPDLMFLDPPTMLFYTLCFASFVAGVYLISWLFPSSYVRRTLKPRFSPTLFLLVPLALGVVASAITNVYLITNYPIILLSLVAQQAGDLKETIAFEVNGHLAFVPLTLMGITWWAFWRYSDLDLKGWRRRLVKFSLFVAVLSVILSSILTLGRNTLMLAVCGLGILYVLRRMIEGRASLTFILKSGITIVLCVSLLFVSFSFLRGTKGWDDETYELIGYTAASYNRLAAVVNGNLHYPFAGHGIYLSGVVAHNQMLLARYLDSPDPLDVWASEFTAVSRAGLDGRLIWSGSFGYIFSDLGWFSPLFIFGYGLLYGIAWRWVRRTTAIGIVLYPCFGFCVLFWVGSNYLLEQPLEILFIVAIILAGYEIAFAKSTKAEVPVG